MSNALPLLAPRLILIPNLISALNAFVTEAMQRCSLMASFGLLDPLIEMTLNNRFDLVGLLVVSSSVGLGSSRHPLVSPLLFYQLALILHGCATAVLPSLMADDKTLQRVNIGTPVEFGLRTDSAHVSWVLQTHCIAIANQGNIHFGVLTCLSLCFRYVNISHYVKVSTNNVRSAASVQEVRQFQPRNLKTPFIRVEFWFTKISSESNQQVSKPCRNYWTSFEKVSMGFVRLKATVTIRVRFWLNSFLLQLWNSLILSAWAVLEPEKIRNIWWTFLVNLCTTSKIATSTLPESKIYHFKSLLKIIN